MITLHTELGRRGYDITVGRGAISEAGRLFSLDRRVLIVTDSGVPVEYAEAVKAQCQKASILTLKEGEGSKSIDGLTDVLKAMHELELTRGDCAVAVGGGMVGDLCGFASSMYMRGIDFYNIPTTLLSDVDSSIGGKTAINFMGVKNTVGAFYQPSGVIIDTDLLKSLPNRQINSGLAEVVKIAITMDEGLFLDIEAMRYEEIIENIENIIVRSIEIKKSVVEADEKESGLRKVLNFGHTLGHGIEAVSGMNELYHGECVALGMIPMCKGEARKRLIAVLDKIGLPTRFTGDVGGALNFIVHDKKCAGESVSAIYCEKIGTFEMKSVSIEEIKQSALCDERFKKT